MAGAAIAAPSASAAAAAGAPCPGADVPATTASAVATGDAIVCLIDAARAARGRPALRRNPRLRTAAQKFASALDPAKPLTHAGRDGSMPLTRIADAGYARGASGFSAAETLGRSEGSLTTPAARVASWLRSASTRRLLLSARYRDVGVGVAGAGSGDVVTFVVEVARRASASSKRASGSSSRSSKSSRS